jgi:hypothetical protein
MVQFAGLVSCFSVTMVALEYRMCFHPIFLSQKFFDNLMMIFPKPGDHTSKDTNIQVMCKQNLTSGKFLAETKRFLFFLSGITSMLIIASPFFKRL